MFEDRSHEKEDTTLDPEEPMISMKKGNNSVPWHPGSMSAPYLYKVTLLGASGAGKSSLAHRLVAHTFDPTYRATRQPAQLFWRHTEVATGKDLMVEIEDTPGVTPAVTTSGELDSRGRWELEQLLRPLVWFEKRRKDKEATRADPQAEAHPLLPGGGPRVTSAVSGRKARADAAGFSGVAKGMSSMASGIAAYTSEAFGGGHSGRANPIGEDRKRMGFVVVADVSSETSFAVAYAIVDRIFDRLQYDVSDPITCPVSVVIVGNKNDLRGGRREVEPEHVIRHEIRQRYFNPHAEPRYAVEYVECSAQTNTGLEQVMLESIMRIRILPTRSRIRTARMRATGVCAKFKRELYSCCPWCFELEECCKYTDKSVLRPAFKRLGLYALCCECFLLVRLYRIITGLISRFLMFRWLCDWCPPIILRLRKEVSAEEEDADIEKDTPKDEVDE